MRCIKKDEYIMVILHIAAIDNNPFNGVCVAAPQHVVFQKKYAEVGFINVKNVEINVLKQFPDVQFEFVKPFDVKKLPNPFDNPDLVVFHECYRLDYLKIAKNLRKYNIPYIDIPHGELRIEAQRKKHLKKVLANLLLFNNFINHAVAIQCLSPAEMEATHFGKERFLGTNGVSMPQKKKIQFSDNNVKFIYIGRYEWRVKGLDLLFEAIQKNADYLRKNKCTFSLYGPDILGRLNQVKQLVSDNQIEDLVSLNLEISGEEKEKKLLESDVFIQTSRHEGLPMGILEALSYGIPCLVSKGTSLAEAIDNNKAGWNAGMTSESISDALKKVINYTQSEWNEYSDNAVNFVPRNYSWDIVTKDILYHYRNLLKR